MTDNTVSRRRRLGDKADEQKGSSQLYPTRMPAVLADVVFSFLPLLEALPTAEERKQIVLGEAKDVRLNTKLACKQLAEMVRHHFKTHQTAIVLDAKWDSLFVGTKRATLTVQGLIQQLTPSLVTKVRVDSIERVYRDNSLADLLTVFKHVTDYSMVSAVDNGMWSWQCALIAPLALPRLERLELVFPALTRRPPSNLLTMVAGRAGALRYLTIRVDNVIESDVQRLLPLCDWDRLPHLVTFDMDVRLTDVELVTILRAFRRLEHLALRLNLTNNIMEKYVNEKIRDITRSLHVENPLVTFDVKVLEGLSEVIEDEHKTVTTTQALEPLLAFRNLTWVSVSNGLEAGEDGEECGEHDLVLRMLRSWPDLAFLCIDAAVKSDFIKETMDVACNCSFLSTLDVWARRLDLTEISQWLARHPKTTSLFGNSATMTRYFMSGAVDWAQIRRTLFRPDFTDFMFTSDTKVAMSDLASLFRHSGGSDLASISPGVVVGGKNLIIDDGWFTRWDELPLATVLCGTLAGTERFLTEPKHRRPRVLVFSSFQGELTQSYRVNSNFNLLTTLDHPASEHEVVADAKTIVKHMYELEKEAAESSRTTRWTYRTRWCEDACARVFAWRLADTDIHVRYFELSSDEAFRDADAIAVVGETDV